jgi:hypothetical protein
LKLLILAGHAFATDLRWRGGRGSSGVGHVYHLISDVVRLMFERIIDPPEHELAL